MICYKNNCKEENVEIVYAFNLGYIYGIKIIKLNEDKYILNKKKFNCSLDGVKGEIILNNNNLISENEDIKNFDLSKNFQGYKILDSKYSNSCLLNLPNNEFVYIFYPKSNNNDGKSQLIKFYKYKDDNSDYYQIKKIEYNMNTKQLNIYKNQILIISYRDYYRTIGNGIFLINLKYKEIVTNIEGMNIVYFFIRNNGEIIIEEEI